MIGFDDIATDRMLLRLVPVAALKAMVREKWSGAAELLHLATPGGLDALHDLAVRRLNQLADDPAYLPWSIRVMILKDTGEMAGYCNFHGRPGAFGVDRHGRMAVEIGYTVLAAYRRRGLATEAAYAMARWAQAQGCDTLVMSIAPDNAASLALAAKFNARKVGEQIDEEDGLEYVYVARIGQIDTAMRNC